MRGEGGKVYEGGEGGRGEIGGGGCGFGGNKGGGSLTRERSHW